jgi:hypothetical protein
MEQMLAREGQGGTVREGITTRMVVVGGREVPIKTNRRFEHVMWPDVARTSAPFRLRSAADAKSDAVHRTFCRFVAFVAPQGTTAPYDARGNRRSKKRYL